VLGGDAPLPEDTPVEGSANSLLRYHLEAGAGGGNTAGLGEEPPPEKVAERDPNDPMDLVEPETDGGLVRLPDDGSRRTVRDRILNPVTDRDRYFVGAAAIGGTAALFTGGLLFRWANAADRVSNFDAQKDTRPRPPEYNDLVRRRNRAGGLAFFTTLAAVGGLGAATYLHLGPERPNLTWAPWVAPGDGAGAQVSFQF